MKTAVLAGILLSAANGGAADPAQCDAKPFSLSKPTQPQTKPMTAKVAKPAPLPTKVAATPPKPKAKPIADCDKPTKKSSG